MARVGYLGGLLLFATLTPAFAQQTTNTRTLQKEVDELRDTVKSLQAEVQDLKAAQAQKQVAPAAAQAAPQAAATTSVAPAAPQAVNVLSATATERSPLPPEQSVSEDPDSASRIDNEASPTNPELKGFIHLPSTQTYIRLGGYAKLDAIYDTGTIGSPDAFATSAIPVPAPHDDSGNFTMQARQTRFSLEIRQPSVFNESLRLYFENDFFGGGSGQYGFRLRQAYGQLGNTYAGFGWSAYDDVDAIPDTLDFAGPGGSLGLRQAGVHQFFRLGETSSLVVAAERPLSEVSSFDGGNVQGTQHVPDVILALRTEHNWGHLQLGGVIRQLGYTDFTQSHRIVAGGASLTGAFKMGTFADYSDQLMFGLNWGKGTAHYLADIGGLGLDAVVDANGKLHAITDWGAYAAYVHYWNSDWRSNLIYGVARVQSTPLIQGAFYRNSSYGAANLLWTPVSPLTVGLEVLHGRLEVQDNRYNDDTRIQGALQYSFIK